MEAFEKKICKLKCDTTVPTRAESTVSNIIVTGFALSKPQQAGQAAGQTPYQGKATHTVAA
jgi:hypothetical protein